jgi:hypothetical protein
MQKFKTKIRGARNFILGMAVMALIFAAVMTVSAQMRTMQATLLFNDIKITLDGETITPADQHGNAVEPFIIDGTVYLPVRGIANALGLGVDWDDESYTVILTNPDPNLVGSWSWTGIQYYTFEENGTGTMAGSAIRWWTSNGVLYICTTPASCRGTCSAPSEWIYEITGDQLTLTNRRNTAMSYTYTKQD